MKMTLRTGFTSTSMFNKLSFIFCIIAMLTAWVSFVMPAWGYDRQTDKAGLLGYGLWRRCGESDTTSGCIDLTGWNLTWYGVVQAFAILGFMGVNLAFCLVILQIWVPRCIGVKEIAFWNAVQCFMTALCYIVAVVVFGAEFDNATFAGNPTFDAKLGYSWGLAIVALAFNGVAVGVCQIMEGLSAVKG